MKEIAKNQNIQFPFHFELLSQSDIKDYFMMRNNFSIEINKSKKGERRESFINTLKVIRSFIERNDADDWKRSLVCGVIFLNCESGNYSQTNILSPAVAINIQQLRILLGKCKSSINGSLQQLGYQSLPASPIGKLYEEVIRKVPYFQQDLVELKKWTFRENESLSRVHSFTLPQINRSLSMNNFQSFQQKSPLYVDLGQKSNVNATSSSSNIFICPLPIIKSHKEALPTPLINFTSPSTPPEPTSKFYTQTQNEMAISVNPIENVVSRFPCPVKFRYKYLNTIGNTTQ